MRTGSFGSAMRNIAGALAGVVMAGCTSSGALCTMSSSSLDPLASATDPDPEASAKLRVFYAAARGVRDAASQAEEMTRLACAAIGADLAEKFPALPPVAGEPHGQQDAATICSAAATRVEAALRDARKGLAFRWSEPRCAGDEARRGRCEALCATAAGKGLDPYCATTCASQASVYATCSAAEVMTSLQTPGKEAEKLMILGATLRRNLPWLIHAQKSVLGRLESDLETLLKTGKDLPRLVPQAGPRGLACLDAAIGLIQDARIDFEQAARGAATVLDGIPKAPDQVRPTNAGEDAS